jgi:thiosulfate dehydrogenase [quinone] large subunit
MPLRTSYYPEPQVSKFIFASKWMAPFWTVVRIYLGWQWLTAGWAKVTNPAWVGSDAGTAIGGYLRGALARSQGDAPTVTAWYGWMIEHIFLPIGPLMSYLVAFGELLVGIALILGLLTGAAAFFGGLMNVAFMFAGTLSTNPLLFMLATWLVLAWRVAGYYGLDRWVLPWLGAPRGTFGKEGSPPPATRTRSSTTA